MFTCEVCGYETENANGVYKHVSISYGKEVKRGIAIDHCPILVYKSRFEKQSQFDKNNLEKMYAQDGMSTVRMATNLEVQKATLISAMRFYGIDFRDKVEQGRNRAKTLGVWNKGKTKFDHASIMRYSQDRIGQNNPYFTAPNFDARYRTSCDNVKYLIRSSPTRNPKTTELRMCKVLDESKISYKRNFCLKMESGKWRLFDFLIEGKILLELQGDYWHANPKYYKPDDMVMARKGSRGGAKAADIWEYDREKMQLGESHGYKFLAIWETEMNEISDKELIGKITEIL